MQNQETFTDNYLYNAVVSSKEAEISAIQDRIRYLESIISEVVNIVDIKGTAMEFNALKIDLDYAWEKRYVKDVFGNEETNPYLQLLKVQDFYKSIDPENLQRLKYFHGKQEKLSLFEFARGIVTGKIKAPK